MVNETIIKNPFPECPLLDVKAVLRKDNPWNMQCTRLPEIVIPFKEEDLDVVVIAGLDNGMKVVQRGVFQMDKAGRKAPKQFEYDEAQVTKKLVKAKVAKREAEKEVDPEKVKQMAPPPMFGLESQPGSEPESFEKVSKKVQSWCDDTMKKSDHE